MKTNDDERPEATGREEIFSGRVFSVARETVREGAVTYTREVVEHPGGAGVVAVFADSSVALVRQYRHPARRYLLELPAGRVEAGESARECAARETEEELGVRAGRLEPLTEFYTTPGFCAEKIWLFLATELTETRQALEEDELVEVVRLPFARALALVESGEIEDAKTVIGLLLAARRLGINAQPEI